MVKHSWTSRRPQSSFGILSLVLNGNRMHTYMEQLVEVMNYWNDLKRPNGFSRIKI